MLPDEAPEIKLNLIFSSSNALITPICAAPFTPPPYKTNPKFINKIT